MENSKELHSIFYRLAMAMGNSLDLREMLTASVSEIISELKLSGAVVLLFKDSVDRKTIYRNILSLPSDMDKTEEFKAALKELGSLKSTLEWDLLRDKLPVKGKKGPVYYYIFSLPHFGLLFLFSQDMLLSSAMVDELVHLSEKLAQAASVCLQNTELEMVSNSITEINRELKSSEKELKTTIERMKDAEEELTSSKNQLAMILQSLGDGVMVLDSNYQVQLMNVRAMEYLNCIPEETFSGVDSFLSSCDMGSVDFIRFLEDPLVEDIEFEVFPHSEHEPGRFLRLRKNQVREIYDNAPDNILLLQDVTRERELDRMKNEFISNLSHELRTPMNAILGISRVLIKKNSDNLNERQLEGLDMINTSGERLLTLINDLLDISKIEAGKMNISQDIVSLEEMAETFRKFTLALIGERDISFHMHISPDTPGQLVSDSQRLNQIMTNLLSNAVKYTEKGEIAIRIFPGDNYLRFECQDTGIGIEPDAVPYIFERFRQADGSVSRKYGGTGLGLALSRELVTLLGGEIGLESTPGVGTLVWFHVPLKVPENAQTSNDTNQVSIDEDAPGGSRHHLLLIADDELIGRETLSMILDSRYELVFARDGEEAVEQFREKSPDIILMDIMMPILNGYQSLSKIRGLPGGKDIPVIAVTARAMKKEKEKILKFGFDGYVSKPVDDDLLLSVIESHLTNKHSGEGYE